jgi:hypothetical protein
MEQGRKAQLKMMEAEVERHRAASSKGDKAGIARGHVALKNQLGTYLKDLEADKDGEMVSSDPTGAWYRAAMALMKEIMDKVGPYVKMVSDEKEGALGPLRRIMEKVADLNEAVTKAEDEPEGLCYKTSNYKTSNYNTSKIQNVKLKNADFKTSKVTKGKITKLRKLQKVEKQKVENYKM